MSDSVTPRRPASETDGRSWQFHPSGRKLGKLSPDAVTASALAGDQITARLTQAPGHSASIGGLKVITANGWFSARPSGTENIYKIYAENFRDEQHLTMIVTEAQQIVSNALAEAGARSR